MPGHALVETELAEQPERRGEVLLAVQAFLLDIAFLGQQRRDIAARHLLSLFSSGVSHDCQITPVWRRTHRLKLDITGDIGFWRDMATPEPQRSKALAHPARIAVKFHGSSRELTASMAVPPPRIGWV